MIVLNQTKELVRLESWADIESLPGFTADVDPRATALERIVGVYGFPDKVRCGLSTCHSPHNKGYLVATVDGRITNIGRDCGRTHFGVEFETMSRKFDRDLIDKENRERLNGLSFRIDDTKAAIAKLCAEQRGADWVHKMSRPLVTPGRGVPEALIRKIHAMVRRRDATLSIERMAREEEVQAREAVEGRTLPRPWYVEEAVAVIDGLPSLYPENDLRKILVLGLKAEILEFEQENVDALGPRELQHWAKWAGLIEPTIERAEGIVELGRRLLTPTNLRPFSQLVERKDQASWDEYLAKLE